MFQLTYRNRCLRVLKKLDKSVQREILGALEKFAEDPFRDLNVKKLHGTEKNAYRLRIDRWRVLYLLIQEDELIEVIDIFLKKSEGDYRKRL